MGALFRQIVFFDWLASRGAWSQAQTDEAAEVAIGMALKHVYPVLQARCRSSNNQVMGMALYCAVAWALGRIGMPATMPALQKLAQDAELNTHVRALAALAALTRGAVAMEGREASLTVD